MNEYRVRLEESQIDFTFKGELKTDGVQIFWLAVIGLSLLAIAVKLWLP